MKLKRDAETKPQIKIDFSFTGQLPVPATLHASPLTLLRKILYHGGNGMSREKMNHSLDFAKSEGEIPKYFLKARENEKTSG